MRWLDHLLPEVCRLEPRTEPPPEVDMAHEYLEAIMRDGLLGDSREIGDTWLAPGNMEHELDFEAPERREIIRRYANRTRLSRTYAWAIPNQAALGALSDLQPLVELGCGGGYWAMLLRERGVDVVAYDRWPPPPDGREGGWAMKAWSEIRPGVGEEVIEQHQERTLLLCWPSPGEVENCWAADTLRRYQGDKLVFVGEAPDGCTGSRAFHRRVGEQFELVSEVEIPRFSGRRDQVWIHQRR